MKLYPGHPPPSPAADLTRKPRTTKTPRTPHGPADRVAREVDVALAAADVHARMSGLSELRKV
jgi:hypothetical protein